jgi:hypothetical protein
MSISTEETKTNVSGGTFRWYVIHFFQSLIAAIIGIFVTAVCTIPILVVSVFVSPLGVISYSVAVIIIGMGAGHILEWHDVSFEFPDSINTRDRPTGNPSIFEIDAGRIRIGPSFTEVSLFTMILFGINFFVSLIVILSSIVAIFLHSAAVFLLPILLFEFERFLNHKQKSLALMGVSVARYLLARFGRLSSQQRQLLPNIEQLAIHLLTTGIHGESVLAD